MTTALVTGATSGIGAEFARQLAARGENLVLVARNRERLEQTAAELTAAHKIHVEVLDADLADRAALARVAERLADQARPIDTLVSNAGFGYPNGLDADTAVHEQAIDVMATAVLVLGNTAAAAMTRRGHGRIITVASLSAWIAQGSYSAVKAFAKVYSEGLSVELHGTGVTATALCPGWVRTEFHDRAGINASKLPGFVWIEADKLVRSCLADAEKGRIESIPDLKWKIAMFIGDHGPRGLARLVSRMLTASRKKH